jgi:hypothetical protein
LKHVRNGSYEVLEREVKANLVYRMFTRMGTATVPAAKTLGKLGRALGSEIVEQMHQRLVEMACPGHVVEGRRMRIATTLTEVNRLLPTMRCTGSGRPTRPCCGERSACIRNPSGWPAMPVFTRRKMNGRHTRWGCSGPRSRIVPPTARHDASTKGNAGSARDKNGGRGARAEAACSNDGTG